MITPKRSLKTAAALLAVLGALSHGHNVRAQGVDLREPLFPRFVDQATAIFPNSTSLSFFTAGTQGTRGGEQDLFVPFSESATGHLFAGVDGKGKPSFAQLGFAKKLSTALTGGVTVVAPSSAKALFATAALVDLKNAGLTLKFGPSVDTSGKLGAAGAVIYGVNVNKLMKIVERVGAGTGQDADLSLSLQSRPNEAGISAASEAGIKRTFGSRATTSFKYKLAIGGDRSYGALGYEKPNIAGREHLFTVSFGTQFGGGRRRRTMPLRNQETLRRLARETRRPTESRRRIRT